MYYLIILSHNLILSKFLLFFILIIQPIFDSHADFFSNFTSPFLTPALSITLLGSGLTYYSFQERDDIDPIEKDVHNDQPLKEYSSIGDLLGQLSPNLIYYSGQWLFGDDRLAEHMSDATFHAGLLTLILKYSVKEKRPDNSNRLSFPSGHTATAFAFASVVGIHHEWYWSVAAYSLASFVGFSRIHDKKHFTHDVIAGATIGVAYGYGTYFANSSTYGLASSKNIQVVPIIANNQNYGFKIHYTF